MGELGIVEGWALIGCDEWDIHASPKGFAGHGGTDVEGGIGEFFRAEATRLQKTATGDGNYGRSMLRLKASQDTVGFMCLAEPSEGRGMEKKVKRVNGKGEKRGR